MQALKFYPNVQNISKPKVKKPHIQQKNKDYVLKNPEKILLHGEKVCCSLTAALNNNNDNNNNNNNNNNKNVSNNNNDNNKT